MSNVRLLMHQAVRSSRSYVYWLAFAPVFAVAAAWLRDAMWFKSFQPTDGLLIVGLVFGVGAVVILVTALLRRYIASSVFFALAALVVAVLTLLAARELVLVVASAGFSRELRGYTNLVSLVASARPGTFMLSVASVPVLFALFATLWPMHTAVARITTSVLAACVLGASVYVAAT